MNHRFERFVQGNEAVNPVATSDSGLGAAWLDDGSLRACALPVSAEHWAFAVRAVLRCDVLDGHPDFAVMLRELAGAPGYLFADGLARDAHATLRDASWQSRRVARSQELANWARLWGCAEDQLTALLVDAHVFAEWLIDVGYFAKGAESAQQRLWLLESPLADRVKRYLTPCEEAPQDEQA